MTWRIASVELISIASEAARIAVGLVFLLSATSKLRNVRGFAQGVARYQVLPAWLSAVYGFSLIPLEILVAISFVSGSLLDLSVPISLLLLTSFFIAVALNIRRRRELLCYCFGSTSTERISKRTLARISMLALAVAVVQLGRQAPIDAARLPAPGSFMTEQRLVDGMLTTTVAFFILISGQWILSLPDLFRLRGKNAID
jgi:uncharacterized membrane protein YphA (DoxX/SURF4 family)